MAIVSPMAPAPKNPSPKQLAGFLDLLDSLCESNSPREATRVVVRGVVALSGLEAAAVRVHDQRDDYPYLAHAGFSDEFIARESPLCRKTAAGRVARDREQRPVLDCVCGQVLLGRDNPGRPGFTPGGAFWSNRLGELMNGPDRSRLGDNIRGTCHDCGYESLGLFPLKSGDQAIGLLQVGSRQPDALAAGTAGLLERLARHLGAVIRNHWRRSELAELARELAGGRRGVEASFALEGLAAALAHEVRNPLAGMMLSATRLKKALDKAGDERLGTIADQLCTATEALSETTNRMMEFARRPRLDRRQASLNEILEGAISLARPRTEEQGVRLVRDLDPRLPPVTADINSLQRAFLNLLLNALDTMPEGGNLRVTTRRLDDGRAETVIADSGPGIVPEQAEKVFEPLFTTKKDGTGLGLSIVRRIIERHDGDARLRPGPGGGTEAVVHLPLARRPREGQA